MAEYSWIAYGAGTPTVAANNVATRLAQAAKAEGRFMANFGQGREQITFDKPILDEMAKREYEGKLATGFFNPAYNAKPTTGGSDAQRGIARAWLKRFIGMDDETFILPQTGRSGLNETFKMFPGHTLVSPYEQWPMIKSIAERAGLNFDLGFYDLSRGTLATGAAAVMDKANPDAKLVLYVGVPSNPRGLFPTRSELRDLLAMLSEYQGMPNRPIVFFDVPYFHAAQQQAQAPYLQTGLDETFFAELRGMKISYLAAFSFSKAFGAATPGYTLFTVSPDMPEGMRTQLVESTSGISYHPASFDAMLQALLTPEQDESRVLPHFKKLADNYRVNCAALEGDFKRVTPALRQAFGDAADFGLLDGDPMMTRLFSLPVQGVFNRVVHVSPKFGMENDQFVIRDTNDFLSCVANVSGVVLVDNDFTRDRKNMLIRVATAEPEARFKQGSQRMTDALVTIATSKLAIS